MRRTAAAPSLAAIDRRTLLARAKDELTESLREHGDATTVAIVLRFVDQLQDVTDRVLIRDYSAERFAFCRVATEIEAAAARAGLVLTERSQFNAEPAASVGACRAEDAKAGETFQGRTA